MPNGGHFAALEESDALAKEVRAFFRPLCRALRGRPWWTWTLRPSPSTMKQTSATQRRR